LMDGLMRKFSVDILVFGMRCIVRRK